MQVQSLSKYLGQSSQACLASLSPFVGENGFPGADTTLKRCLCHGWGVQTSQMLKTQKISSLLLLTLKDRSPVAKWRLERGRGRPWSVRCLVCKYSVLQRAIGMRRSASQGSLCSPHLLENSSKLVSMGPRTA